MNTPAISFIIINYNGANILQDCLESIKRQSISNYEVFVVDNNSSDNSWQQPFFEMPNWNLIRLLSNMGFSPANNIAFNRTKAPVIALINNDVVLGSTWAEEVLCSFAQSGKDCGMIACKLLQKKSPTNLDSAGFDYSGAGIVCGWSGDAADCLEGKQYAPFGAVAAAAAYKREALQETGLFHDEYFAYYEDTDLAIRLRLFGWTCTYAPKAVALHVGSATGKKHSAFQGFYLRRNIELLYWVDMPGWLSVKYLPGHFMYELLCLFGMLCRGQISAFFRAKFCAIKMAPWIVKKRRQLMRNVKKKHELSVAKHNLISSITPTKQLVLRNEFRKRISSL